MLGEERIPEGFRAQKSTFARSVRILNQMMRRRIGVNAFRIYLDPSEADYLLYKYSKRKTVETMGCWRVAYVLLASAEALVGISSKD